MRYFVAYNLPEPEASAVDDLRKEISSRFAVTAALRLPPHLTLAYPFETDDLSRFEPALSALASAQAAFAVAVTGFGSFDEAVWYLDVEQKKELASLMNGIAEIMDRTLVIAQERRRRDTHFHVTLAYKDVTPEAFRLIGNHLSGMAPPITGITVDALTLLRHEGGKWLPQRTYPFGTA